VAGCAGDGAAPGAAATVSLPPQPANFKSDSAVAKFSRRRRASFLSSSFNLLPAPGGLFGSSCSIAHQPLCDY
jgi:hypothetical protein